MGILFCEQPVRREKDVLLTHLVDRELLRRASVGMAREIGAPLTIYAGNVFRVGRREDVVWTPAEQFVTKWQSVPMGYNPFCQLCRSTVVGSLLNQFEGKVRPDNCPVDYAWKGTCAGQPAYCLERDWDRCPAFLTARRRQRFCYESDTKLIARMARAWAAPSFQGWATHKCWAGLTEFAAPIVVHDLLVGVMMTGQFVIDGRDLSTVDEVIDRLPNLKQHKERLGGILTVLGGARAQTQEEVSAGSFRLQERDLAGVVDILQANAERLERSASSAYLNFRVRSEALLRKEVIARMDAVSSEKGPIDALRVSVLGRLRQFWGFSAVYLVACPVGSGVVSVLARDGEDGGRVFTPFGKRLGRIRVGYGQMHPLSFLFDRQRGRYPVNEYAKEVCGLLETAWQDADLLLPFGRSYYCVIAPVGRVLYMLLFAVRKPQTACPLPARDEGGVSEVCQEAIFETGTEVIRAIGSNADVQRIAEGSSDSIGSLFDSTDDERRDLLGTTGSGEGIMPC